MLSRLERPAGQRGQTATEYIGVLAVIALLVASVRPVAPVIAAGLETAVCRLAEEDPLCAEAAVAGGDGSPATADPGSPAAVPAVLVEDRDADGGGDLPEGQLDAPLRTAHIPPLDDGRDDDPGIDSPWDGNLWPFNEGGPLDDAEDEGVDEGPFDTADESRARNRAENAQTPVDLPDVEEQTGPLPIDLPNGWDLPNGPKIPLIGVDLPDGPDIGDFDDYLDPVAEGVLSFGATRSGAFGDLVPHLDEIADYYGEIEDESRRAFPGSPSPRSDRTALSIAYALLQEDAQVEVVDCGQSGSGVPIVCVNHAEDAVQDGPDAFTMGHVVFCEDTCRDELLDHEQAHVEQFEEYGDAFNARYLTETARHGPGCDNRYEQEANEVSDPGRPCEQN
jgi:hypothetical protein